MKRLVINADDFGISSLVNKGIVDCIRHGIVTSTSILANGNAFYEAKNLARKYKIDTGIHLNLTTGKPLTRAKKLIGNDGNFSHKNLGRAILGRLDIDEVEKELRAQIKKIISAGLKPSHIDGHKHIHVFPGIRRIAAGLANEFGITHARLPINKRIKLKQIFTMQFPKSLIVNHFARKARKIFVMHGLSMPKGFYGMLETGRLSTENLKSIIADIKQDTAELMCHPGYFDNKLSSKLRDSREIELRALTSREAREAVSKHKIRLERYGDI